MKTDKKKATSNHENQLSGSASYAAVNLPAWAI
jgi:hypothetical protein